MQGIQRETLLKSVDRLVVTACLQMKLPEKVQGVGVVGIQAGHLLKGVDRGGVLSKRSINHAEVVPSARVLRFTPSGIEKNVARFVKLLAVEERNAFIQTRRKKRWVFYLSAPERLKRFGNACLIHVRDAEVVQ